MSLHGLPNGVMLIVQARLFRLMQKVSKPSLRFDTQGQRQQPQVSHKEVPNAGVVASP